MTNPTNQKKKNELTCAQAENNHNHNDDESTV